jgi:hypothetical protein
MAERDRETTRRERGGQHRRSGREGDEPRGSTPSLSTVLRIAALLFTVLIGSLAVVSRDARAQGAAGPGEGIADETSASIDVPIVYVSRELPEGAGIAATLGASLPENGGRQTFRGRLLVARPNDRIPGVLCDGNSPRFPPGSPKDVSDPSVSWDGQFIVFSGYSPTENAWRIYEVRPDGLGLRQVTHSDRVLDLSGYGGDAAVFARYDDYDPCYLADGRICFASTRHPGLSKDGRSRTTNLFVVEPDGSDLHRITSEKYSADSPAVDPTTGRIVYSRWWVTPGATGIPGIVDPSPEEPLRGLLDSEFSGINVWQLGSIRPDGAGLSLWSGTGLDRRGTMAYRPSFLPDGRVLSLDLFELPQPGLPLTTDLRLGASGTAAHIAIGGAQVSVPGAVVEVPSAGYYQRPIEVQLPDVLSAFFFSSAEALPDGRVLVAGFRQTDSAQSDIFVLPNLDIAARAQHLLGMPNRWELDAVPIIARAIPPVLRDEAQRLSSNAPPVSFEAAKLEKGDHPVFHHRTTTYDDECPFP